MAETPYVREPGYAERYRDRRFQCGTGPRTDQRERNLLRNLLAQAAAHLPQRTTWRWLDIPCGTGRMSAELPGQVVQVDRDPNMPALCAGDCRVAASAQCLPFLAQTFHGVLCHRLLQHIPSAAERHAILRELRRVGSHVLIASFFDAWSFTNLRRQLQRALGKPRTGRNAISRRAFCAELHAAGWQPLALAALARGWSEQTLVLCRAVGSGKSDPITSQAR